MSSCLEPAAVHGCTAGLPGAEEGRGSARGTLHFVRARRGLLFQGGSRRFAPTTAPVQTCTALTLPQTPAAAGAWHLPTAGAIKLPRPAHTRLPCARPGPGQGRGARPPAPALAQDRPSCPPKLGRNPTSGTAVPAAPRVPATRHAGTRRLPRRHERAGEGYAPLL